MTPNWKVIHADALEGLRTLPSNSVQCCVTSPPYWNLRNYNAVGQIGLEKTDSEYLEALLKVFEEVKRVLRDDGLLFVNIGDTYVDKELCAIPWRFALLMRLNGWCLIRDIIWNKRRGMPESTKTRPTSIHEYIFMFAKQKDYFSDFINMLEDALTEIGTKSGKGSAKRLIQQGVNARPEEYYVSNGKRMMRSVWSISTANSFDGHFAVYPEEIVERCLRIATTDKGCCASCFAPIQREYVKVGGPPPRSEYVKTITKTSLPGYTSNDSCALYGGDLSKMYNEYGYAEYKTVSWNRTCVKNCKSLECKICNGHGCESCVHTGIERIPNVVLDPFCGSGTTGVVALKMQRSFIGIELNGEYVELSRRNICKDMSLFNTNAEVDNNG